ncbi:hypothetical protein [Frateuria aurantia]|uniref:Lipoprotein n=1 Tax=Frateuria aurantia (strain ATCC 33424 / DSM 6220 / KCTC 2777 / LMG 1558 / NBRC 3245 / NCIMB 13370) TaxID=767434 RepID=H8L6Y7_FRAAD|nr:hypothetical protein [Frateuria aurantia]AFC86897.1 hypothetical protein Fraau_2550 [Frateuria aurantia DSM 6220]
MKKPVVFVVAPALLISVLLVSGCSIFRSHKAWETAKQESPLEIPPGLDTPATTDALVVPPPGANQPTANGATAQVTGAPSQLTDGFVVPSDAGTAYQRLGEALAKGDIGKVIASDATARTYSVTVVSPAAVAPPEHKRGMFSRLFHHGSKSVSGADEASAHDVQVTVVPSGSDASVIQVQGISGAVAQTVSRLRSAVGAKD